MNTVHNQEKLSAIPEPLVTAVAQQQIGVETAGVTVITIPIVDKGYSKRCQSVFGYHTWCTLAWVTLWTLTMAHLGFELVCSS